MLNVAIIGLGKMGISHCSIINAHPLLNLVAVCDASTLVLEAFNKYTNMKVYTDYKKMLNENQLDCLFVATPTKYHAEMVLTAFDKNIHVFCEKPFSLTVQEAKQMVDTAKSKNLVNQVGYHNRFIGTFNFMKELVENGILGNIYHFTGEAYGPVVVKKKSGTWRSKKSEGGGCLFDYASHVINLVEYILGDISKVDGTQLKKIFSTDVDDAVYSSMYLKSGIGGTLSVNWSDETYRKMSTQLSVFGTEGKMIADAQEIKIYLKSENKKYGFEKGWNMKYITDLTPPVDFYLRGEEYSAQIDYFAKQVNNKKFDNRNSFETAYKTDLVIEQLLTSSNTK